MSSEDEMDDFEVSDYDMLGAMGKLKELWFETNRIFFSIISNFLKLSKTRHSITKY